MAMGSKAFESPLISHARMRALYRGLVELRVQLAKRHEARGLEAAWVATAIDLQEGDLTCDAGARDEAALLGNIRSIGKRTGTGAPLKSAVRRMRKQLAILEPPAFPGNEADRLIYSCGAAMGLRAAGQERVVMAYTGFAPIGTKDWLRVLAVMGQPGLPMVLMAMPGAITVDLEALARKVAARPDHAIPVIPVDSGDVVALYRVAQETIGRARASGGSAVIAAADLGTDPVKLMGSQLVKKGICTARWIEAVEPDFRELLRDM
jgi:TPP-dependent pyruvate/acetoin dehydrogenase alpha subunit